MPPGVVRTKVCRTAVVTSMSRATADLNLRESMITEGRPLEQIRSDLRAAKGFAISDPGAARFQELLREARSAAGSRDEFAAICREMGIAEPR